jgi:DNA-directed RNA polymerase subunit RPC12/RpoP
MKSSAKCNCEKCGGHIEFNPTQLTVENDVITCPHCGSATRLVVAKASASNYQKTILRDVGISDVNFTESLDEAQANQAIESAKQIKEYLFELRRDGFVKERIPKDTLNALMCLNSSGFPTVSAFLEHIRRNFSKALLSEQYGKAKAHKEQERQEIMQEGKYAPSIRLSNFPARRSGESDATPAQKRFLRDLGVRDEQKLATLGKDSASELIEKLLNERDRGFKTGAQKSGCLSILVVSFALGCLLWVILR